MTAGQVESPWQCQRRFNTEELAAGDPMLVVVGCPTDDPATGEVYLDAAAGSHSVSGPELEVLGLLAEHGAFAGYSELPNALRPVALNMLNDGLLLAHFVGERRCYRGNLVPVPVPIPQDVAATLIVHGRTRDHFGVGDPRNPDSVAEFSRHHLFMFQLVDGNRTINTIVSEAVQAYIHDAETADQIRCEIGVSVSADDLGSILEQLFVNGLLAFAQHGHLWLDIPSANTFT